MSSIPKSSIARIYLRCTRARRKIIQFFIHLGREFKGNIFPSVEKIAWWCKCSIRCVQNFIKWNKELGNIFFTVGVRKRPNGSQSSNLYKMEKVLVDVMAWLIKRSLQNIEFSRIEEIIESIEKNSICTPNFFQPAPPYTDSSLERSENTKTVVLSKYFEGIGIPKEAQLYLLTRFSEHIVQETIHFYWRAVHKGSIWKTPKAYMIGTAKKLASKAA